jgi:hypothetical protein
MTDSQLKDLLEIIIEKTYYIPDDSYPLKQHYPYQLNKAHVALITIEPVKLNLFSRKYLRIIINTFSETGRWDTRTFKLYDSYYYKTVTETLLNKNGLKKLQKDLIFKEAINNTIENLLE